MFLLSLSLSLYFSFAAPGRRAIILVIGYESRLWRCEDIVPAVRQVDSQLDRQISDKTGRDKRRAGNAAFAANSAPGLLKVMAPVTKSGHDLSKALRLP